MEEPGSTLTGLWHGQYSYPDVRRAPVAFSANLIETESFLTGSITERATLGRITGSTLLATVRGERTASQVAFLKIYEPNRGAYLTVSYAGTLSGDALEIDGAWQTQGWSGRFLMMRARGLRLAVARRVEEKV